MLKRTCVNICGLHRPTLDDYDWWGLIRINWYKTNIWCCLTSNFRQISRTCGAENPKIRNSVHYVASCFFLYISHPSQSWFIIKIMANRSKLCVVSKFACFSQILAHYICIWDTTVTCFGNHGGKNDGSWPFVTMSDILVGEMQNRSCVAF